MRPWLCLSLGVIVSCNPMSVAEVLLKGWGMPTLPNLIWTGVHLPGRLTVPPLKNPGQPHTSHDFQNPDPKPQAGSALPVSYQTSSLVWSGSNWLALMNDVVNLDQSLSEKMYVACDWPI